MRSLSKEFTSRDRKIGLYNTLLRNRLGEVFTSDDIEDIFTKLRKRAPSLLENGAVTKEVDITKVIQCIAVKEEITWREAKAFALRDPERLLTVAAYHATHPDMHIVETQKASPE